MFINCLLLLSEIDGLFPVVDLDDIFNTIGLAANSGGPAHDGVSLGRGVGTEILLALTSENYSSTNLKI